MPVQQSPPSKNTRSQKNSDFLTPTVGVPLDLTQSVHQLSRNLDRREEPSRRGGMNSVRSISFSGLLRGYPGICKRPRTLAEIPEAPNLTLSNRLLVSQAVPKFLKIIKKRTQSMGKLTQAVSPRENSRTLAFNSPLMKEPHSLDGIQAHKLRGFIQSCQSIFYNEPESFFSDRKKLLFSLVELENGLNHISQTSPMKTLPTS
ncbi:hypothetical protein O181_013059 [Austropuccinia psidii MF-1]|uniref:Uncharacterized protein n=1 Tax=Austropuccinia psidii MF-1 TaxID=1389203 RepID=A0A9Q3BXG4_9BASI|nr:hypothetical protein [Austropuccinia psidii MF-1]